MENHKYQNIIFFDELCPFCTKWVPCIINHSKINFYISPLSSRFAQKKLNLNKQIDSINFESIIILQSNEVIKDGAAIKFIIKNTTGILSILKLLLIFSDSTVNTIYKIFTKNRTRIFGRHKSCPKNIVENEKFIYE
tara:strand:- start:2578 stop:2988 length:411 start_codon:yes stop_codon:yes gene_type:complete